MDTNLDTIGKRLQWILNDLDITPYAFSKALGFKSPDSVYHIFNGRNGLSKVFMDKIEKSDFKINVSWLLTGRGVPYISMIFNSLPGRYYADKVEITPAKLDKHYLKLFADKMADLIFENGINEDFTVAVRICGISGVEYLFTSFSKFGKERIVNRKYTAILQPNWKVTGLFEFLKPDEENQTALDLSIIKNAAGVGLLESIDLSIHPLLVEMHYYFLENQVVPFLNLNMPYTLL